MLAELLCPWWTVFKALLGRVAPGDRKKKDTCVTSIVAPAPSALLLSKTQGSNHKLVRDVGGEPEDGSLAPQSFDPGGEPDLFPPNLRDRWAALRKQAAQRGMWIYCMLFWSFTSPINHLDGKACLTVS